MDLRIIVRQLRVDLAPINDRPTFDPVPAPPTVLEDSPAQIVSLFVNNASAGLQDEDQTLAAVVTVTGPLGPPTNPATIWSKDEFFSVATAVDVTVGSPNYGRLTYTVAPSHETAVTELFAKTSRELMAFVEWLANSEGVNVAGSLRSAVSGGFGFR